MPHATDLAMQHLKKVLARDPMLRDILAEALPGLAKGPGFTPDVDVYEDTGRHVVIVDLPGVRREDVRVRLEGARLVIEGTRTDHRPEGAASRSTERPFGPFKREFLLPTDVDAEGVRAHLEEGVLRVEVPRMGAGRSRDIVVDGAPSSP